MSNIRPAAVSGSFYNANAANLRREIIAFLGQVPVGLDGTYGKTKVLIAPHAGYVYSGAIAARAYAQLADQAEEIERVILLGPAHHIPVYSVCGSSADYFQTPLGRVQVDQPLLQQLGHFKAFVNHDAVHQREHSLEVQLPFLQMILPEFSLIPLVVGMVEVQPLSQIIEYLWGGRETIFVVSTDLSHFLDYEQAQQLDMRTANSINHFDYESLESNSACGHYPLAGMLSIARKKALHITQLDLRNSADTAGSRDRVVGYGAWAMQENG